MVYIIQTILYSGILLLIYQLFLRDRPAHRFNRVYLLSSAVLPLVLPLMKFAPLTLAEKYRAALFNVQIPEVVIGDGQLGERVQDVLTWLFVGYGLVSVIVMLVNTRKLLRLRTLINSADKKQNADHTLLMNTGYGPGSWGNYIFLPGNEADERILNHERAHVLLKHSADVVYMLCVQSLTWYNPFFYHIRRELRLVHEYQADQYAATDNRQYLELLLSNVFHNCAVPLTHTFFHHPIKRRIMMLNKSTKGSHSRMRIIGASAVCLLFLAAAVSVQSCGDKQWEIKKNDVAATPVAKKAEEQPAVMPEFPGGNVALTSFIIKNLKYPKEAMDKKIEGRVVIHFAVGEDGKIKDPEIAKSPDPSLSQAALDIVNAMPAWVPGEAANGEKVCVKYTLPISFKL